MAIFQKKNPLNKEQMIQNDFKRYTLKQLVSKFYVSRFNRDPYVPTDKDEDINNSRKFRLYNKTDVMELLSLFVEFFEDLLCEESVEDIHISPSLSLYRDVEMPKIKNVTAMDRKLVPGIPENDSFYITRGRYTYKLKYSNEVRKRLDEKWIEDPRYKSRTAEIREACIQKNKEVRDGK